MQNIEIPIVLICSIKHGGCLFFMQTRKKITKILSVHEKNIRRRITYGSFH